MKLVRAAAWSCMLLWGAGCAACHHRDNADRQIDRVYCDRMRMEPVPMPRSTLFDGDGLDPLAFAVGRTPWPAAPRDIFGGEEGTYYEFFYDVEGTPLGHFWGDNSFTWRQFRSDRIGAFRR